MTLTQMAAALGLKDTSSLRRAIQRGALTAEMAGKTYMVEEDEVEKYRREHLGKRGFASPLHPGGRPPKPKP
jgi:excisionase family DNA binding protein